MIFSLIKILNYPFLNGLTVKINFGNKVKTEIIARSIAIPVKTPK